LNAQDKKVESSSLVRELGSVFVMRASFTLTLFTPLTGFDCKPERILDNIARFELMVFAL